MTEFTIQGRLPGLNEMINAARANRYMAASIKKKETQRCAWSVVGSGMKKIDSPIFIDINWYEPNKRRDIDNVAAGAKFILDGLVEAGKLTNDGRKWVVGLVHHFPAPDAKNPRIVVQVRNVE